MASNREAESNCEQKKKKDKEKGIHFRATEPEVTVNKATIHADLNKVTPISFVGRICEKKKGNGTLRDEWNRVHHQHRTIQHLERPTEKQ